VIKRTIILGLIVCFAAGTAFSQAISKKELVGTWKIAEVVSADGKTDNKNPQPSLYIITDTHYSMQLVTAERPSYGSRTTADLTDKQKSDMWTPYTANSGTWEVKGDEITIHPVVAKTPFVMAKGSFTTYTVKKDGDAIWITSKANETGPATNPNKIKLVRVK
jgi:hypothetical protein